MLFTCTKRSMPLVTVSAESSTIPHSLWKLFSQPQMIAYNMKKMPNSFRWWSSCKFSKFRLQKTYDKDCLLWNRENVEYRPCLITDKTFGIIDKTFGMGYFLFGTEKTFGIGYVFYETQKTFGISYVFYN